MQGYSLTPQMASRVQVLAECLGWEVMAPTVLAMAGRPVPNRNKLLDSGSIARAQAFAR